MSQIYWRTRTGKLLKITDMTIEHLTNTIAFIDERTEIIDDKWDEEYEAMCLELEYRGQLYEGITPIPGEVEHDDQSILDAVGRQDREDRLDKALNERIPGMPYTEED